METISQFVAAFGVALSLYGSLQLANRLPVEMEPEKLASFWRSLWQVVFRGQVPPDSGGGFLASDRKSRVGWRFLIAGFLIQFLGNVLLPVVRIAVKLAN